jgi:DNA repair exonuclease SbcCD nuclease subunit
MRFIVTGDNHLRPDMPLCRLDEDWLATQRAQFDFIVEKANEFQADLIITGDLFDVPRVPPKIVSLFLDSVAILSGKCYVIAGNHSLPWHKEENVMDSSIGILKVLPDQDSKIIYLEAEEYTEKGRFEHVAKIDDDLFVIHTLTFPTVTEIPYGAEAVSAYQLLEKYPDARFIFTGDYHHNFVVEDENRYVINPGCMNVQAADMIDYSPCVYFVDTGTKIDVTTKSDKRPVYRTSKSSIERIELPNDPTVLTRNHLDQQKARDTRISSFVESIQHDGQIGLSFEDNLEKAILVNDLSPSVVAVLEEVKEELHG